SYLFEVLDLEPIDRDILRAVNRGEGGGRLFGGQVAAQALRAASATVDVEQRPNSLHAYFLRPGRYAIPITYVVHRIRDGPSSPPRRVVALQDGEAILNLDASYPRDEPGDEYQIPSVLDVTDPPDDRQPAAGPPASRPHRRAFEMRETVVH